MRSDSARSFFMTLRRPTMQFSSTVIFANRLKLWLGEWSLAPNSGVDWLGLMNQSNAVDPVRRIEAALRDAILADSRITKISSMDISFDRSTRTISATIGMITDGEAIEVKI